MKHIFKMFAVCCLLGLFFSCGGSGHFITDETYRRQVENDFNVKKSLMPEGGFFDVFNESLTDYEREAMTFLYAYMPTADITDYPASFHLMNIHASQRAMEEMPWGKAVPEDLFRHFVLPVRVNNEHLDSARVVFYEELKPRVEKLSMYDAVLEVNHWCHEKAIYQPSDGRTSSPLATVKTAYGRCGEESTFLVAALRAIGIPARQVYTPRWAHTDDNHAWVEAWADGKWYFLGACEPEPVLNLAWFNAPASRGMLMHTKVFGRYNGPEEVMLETPNYTEINVIENYAPTTKLTVTVKDTDGKVLDGAAVEFKLYNYGEFYTVARKLTAADGTCGLTAGKGDMLVWASKDGRFGFAKASFGKQDNVTLTLDKKEGDVFNMDIDIVPPVETANLPEVTPEQRAENTRRMMVEDSIRNAYVATMMDEARAVAAAKNLKGLSEAEAKSVASYLVASRGNHQEILGFLTTAVAEKKGSLAVEMLGALSEKDLRDAKMAVLLDHLRNTPVTDVPNFVSCVLNPRIYLEELTPYKSFFKGAIAEADAKTFAAEPQKLVEWCQKNITVNDSINSQRILMSPEGVWRARVADSRSFEIFFIAMARSLGIPAWIDQVTGTVRYMDSKATTYDVDFASSTTVVSPETGKLKMTFKPTKFNDDPKYYYHFTMSKFENGSLSLQEYDEGAATWKTLFQKPLPVVSGYYVLVSGTRLASGSVLVNMNSFTVKSGETTTAVLKMRESDKQVQVIGNLNSEDLFTPLENGKPAAEPVSLLKVCGRGYFTVGIIGPGQEPTNHALNDISKLKAELEKWGRTLVLLFPDEASAQRFKASDFPELPSTVVYGIDTHGIAAEIIENMKLHKAGALPIFVMADTFNRVVFVSQGYTIGLGEQFIQTVRGL